MKINLNSKSIFLSENQVNLIENKYNAKYIYETQLMGPNGWTDDVGSIFYQEHPPLGYSNWFAIIQRWSGEYMITSAEETVKYPINAVRLTEDKYSYSHHRHHYVSNSGGIDIDGGREYTRLIGNDIRSAICRRFTPTPDGLIIMEHDEKG
jgi:hypothetical protein